MLPSRAYHATVSFRIAFSVDKQQLSACQVLSVDFMDISGETQTDIIPNIIKTRLDERGAPVPTSKITELRNDVDKLNEQRQSGYCGSCYGGIEPAGGCCNTCEDVRQAYVNRGWSFNSPDAIEQVSRNTFWGSHFAHWGLR